jgi:hypothetical protein
MIAALEGLACKGPDVGIDGGDVTAPDEQPNNADTDGNKSVRMKRGTTNGGRILHHGPVVNEPAGLVKTPLHVLSSRSTAEVIITAAPSTTFASLRSG